MRLERPPSSAKLAMSCCNSRRTAAASKRPASRAAIARTRGWGVAQKLKEVLGNRTYGDHRTYRRSSSSTPAGGLLQSTFTS